MSNSIYASISISDIQIELTAIQYNYCEYQRPCSLIYERTRQG